MAAKVWSSDASLSKGHCSDGLHVPRPNKGNVAIPYEDDAVTIPWWAIIRVVNDGKIGQDYWGMIV